MQREGVHWIKLARNRERGRAIVDKVIVLRIP